VPQRVGHTCRSSDGRKRRANPLTQHRKPPTYKSSGGLSSEWVKLRSRALATSIPILFVNLNFPQLMSGQERMGVPSNYPSKRIAAIGATFGSDAASPLESDAFQTVLEPVIQEPAVTTHFLNRHQLHIPLPINHNLNFAVQQSSSLARPKPTRPIRETRIPIRQVR